MSKIDWHSSEWQIDCWIFGKREKDVVCGWGCYYPVICKLTDIWAD